MDTSKHSELPWSDNGNEIVDRNGRVVGGAITEADADLMVRAANSHDQLVAALKMVKDHGGICSSSTLDAVCAALAAAGA